MPANCLLYQGIAKAVNEQYQTFDFDSWRGLRVRVGDDATGIVGGLIRVPRVILLAAFDWVPKRHVRFSRVNIYAHDANTCQYCGQRMARSKLNLDHVVPRSQGGRSTWENVVCCCLKCNVKKGGRTPAQAHMKLVAKPIKPTRSPAVTIRLSEGRYRSWKQFLDNAYWNVELQ